MTTLAQAHRLLQNEVGAQTASQMLSIWPLIDPANVSGTFADYLDVAYTVIQSGNQQSVELAAAYYAAARETLFGVDSFVPVLAPTISREQIYSSLGATALARIRQGLIRSEDWARITDKGASLGAGAGMRLALAGGRETLLQSTRADPRAVGWQRVTSGNACEFCEMLAERGVVYAEEAADFAAHDNCGCFAQPEFSQEQTAVRDYTPSERFSIQEQRDANNERIRAALADRRNGAADEE